MLASRDAIPLTVIIPGILIWSRLEVYVVLSIRYGVPYYTFSIKIATFLILFVRNSTLK